jgi:hypothetical protein
MKESTIEKLRTFAIAIWALGMAAYFFGEITGSKYIPTFGIWVLLSAIPVTGIYLVASFFGSAGANEGHLSDAGEILFTQVDSTENFNDSEGLDSGEWIKTTPLNESMDNPESMGLPVRGSSEDEVHHIASDLSAIRESLSIPEDGVYCPVCNVANVDRQKLRTPCPTCGRDLLAFGWD